MDKDIYAKTIKELTLMLLYLNSWTEKDFPDNLRRSWKNHDFDTLDELEEEGLVSGSKRAKSVYIGEDGINAARDLLKKYGIEIP